MTGDCEATGLIPQVSRLRFLRQKLQGTLVHLRPQKNVRELVLLGSWSQNSEYNWTVPASVSVQRGLCVHIPCSFTYNQRDRTSPGTLYGYWFLNKDGYQHYFTRNPQHSSRGILVATNDERQEIRTSVENRFQFTGDPEEGNCSFSILNARSEDEGDYYFRIEDGYLKYSYISSWLRTHTTLQVLVTGKTFLLMCFPTVWWSLVLQRWKPLEEPQLGATSVVLSGKEAVYTCLALGLCVKIDAKISWDSELKGNGTSQWSQQHSNGSWTYGSNFTFTPSLNDQGKRLTCWVWYPNIWASVEKRIQLEVADPPKTVEISTNATDRGHLGLCSPAAQGDLDSAVVQEGESISLTCTAESRPNPTLSWRKRNKTLNSTRQGKDRVLLLSSVRPKDAGEYQCWAETPQGSANKTLRLCVLYGPRFSSTQRTSVCQHEDNNLLCTCSLHSWPPPRIQWQVDGETINQSIPGQALGVLFQAQGNELTSTLNWTGSWKEKHSIICFATNPSGAEILQFVLGSSITTAHNEVLGPSATFFMIILCLIKVLFCFLFFFSVFRFSNQRKAPSRGKQ
ncbi:UNVERIFIED_CONTAM: hypothetical protein K2H54_024382 [Gekko kuhli]